MSNRHFISRFIAEDTNIHFIAKTFSFQKVLTLNHLPNLIKTFLYVTHQSFLTPNG